MIQNSFYTLSDFFSFFWTSHTQHLWPNPAFISASTFEGIKKSPTPMTNCRDNKLTTVSISAAFLNSGPLQKLNWVHRELLVFSQKKSYRISYLRRFLINKHIFKVANSAHTAEESKWQAWWRTGSKGRSLKTAAIAPQRPKKNYLLDSPRNFV